MLEPVGAAKCILYFPIGLSIDTVSVSMIDDLRILRGFVAVAEELNFRAAAERLHMSQPPLSRMISSLEAQVGTPLFVRSTRRVELTREGRQFLSAATDVLDVAAAAGRKIRHQFSSAQRPLLIGSTSAAYFAGFPDLLKSFRSQHPGLPVETSSMNSADQMDALLSGRLDVGFVLPPAKHREVSMAVFTSIRMRLAISEEHPLSTQKLAPLESFMKDTFILHERGKDPGMYEGILQCCNRAGFRPKVRVKREDEHCMALVTSGAGVHFSAAGSSCLHLAGVSLLDLTGEAPKLEIVTIWRKDDPSETLRTFLEFVLSESPSR